MSPTVIVENLGKRYRLGLTHAGSLRELFNRTAGRLVPRRANHQPDPALTNGRKATRANSGEFWAIRDISFQVQRGEVLGVIGRNGAGKSTLLKVLSRVTVPTAGRIKLGGRVASLLEVGTGFHPELTGRENVFLNGAILGMTKAEIRRKFDDIVEFSETGKFIDTPVKRYSSGMKVRLGFAVAAHLEPEILIIDEVLAVGDVGFQRRCLGKMQDITQQGRTVLFVSHNLASVEQLCSRSLLLDAGRVVASGPSREVIRSYLQRNTAGHSSKGVWSVNEALLRQHQADSDLSVSLESIELRDLDGRPLGELSTGDGLRIRIQYDARKRLVSPGVMVVIRNQQGIEIARLSNMPICGHYIESVQGRGSVELELPELPLLGGEYHLDIEFARSGIEVLWMLEQLVTFQVAATDVYGSGLALDNRWGLISLPHRWSHQPELIPADQVTGSGPC